MALLLSTTGNAGTSGEIFFPDLGNRFFNHPTTNFDIEEEYFLHEVLESDDILAALTANEITLNFDGSGSLSVSQFQELARGNMQTTTYDSNDNNLVDLAENANLLNGTSGDYYLARANHTGTQLAATISDFTNAARQTISVASGSQQFLNYNNSTGEFTVQALAITSVTVDTISTNIADWATANYTGTEFQEGDVIILVNVPSGTEVYIHNGGSYGTAGIAGDETDFTIIERPNLDNTFIRELFSGSEPIIYNPLTGNISIRRATASTSGYLDASDFDYFNNKVDSVNGVSGPIVTINTDDVNEGTTNLYFTEQRARDSVSANAPLLYYSTSGVFDIQQATTNTDGYLSSTDWNTFNNKSSVFYIGDLLDVSTSGVANGYALVYDSSDGIFKASSIEVGKSWNVSGGKTKKTTNAFVNFNENPMNISPYVIPLNANIKYISVATSENETWVAEVRVNGVTQATLSITAATSAVSTELAVAVNAGDVISYYVSGSGIDDANISVLYEEII